MPITGQNEPRSGRSIDPPIQQRNYAFPYCCATMTSVSIRIYLGVRHHPDLPGEPVTFRLDDTSLALPNHKQCVPCAFAVPRTVFNSPDAGRRLRELFVSVQPHEVFLQGLREVRKLELHEPTNLPSCCKARPVTAQRLGTQVCVSKNGNIGTAARITHLVHGDSSRGKALWRDMKAAQREILAPYPLPKQLGSGSDRAGDPSTALMGIGIGAAVLVPLLNMMVCALLHRPGIGGKEDFANAEILKLIDKWKDWLASASADVELVELIDVLKRAHTQANPNQAAHIAAWIEEAQDRLDEIAVTKQACQLRHELQENISEVRRQQDYCIASEKDLNLELQYYGLAASAVIREETGRVWQDIRACMSSTAEVLRKYAPREPECADAVFPRLDDLSHDVFMTGASPWSIPSASPSHLLFGRLHDLREDIDEPGFCLDEQRYKLGSAVLGSGMTGKVYLCCAEDNPKVLYAAKISSRESDPFEETAEEVVRRLEREARMMHHAQAPLRPFAFALGESRALLLLPLARCVLANALTHASRLTLPRATVLHPILAGLATELAKMHRAGMTHSDIKLENVFITADHWRYSRGFRICRDARQREQHDAGSTLGRINNPCHRAATQGHSTE